MLDCAIIHTALQIVNTCTLECASQPHVSAVGIALGQHVELLHFYVS